jgi:hypothetical protein
MAASRHRVTIEATADSNPCGLHARTREIFMVRLSYDA